MSESRVTRRTLTMLEQHYGPRAVRVLLAIAVASLVLNAVTISLLFFAAVTNEELSAELERTKGEVETLRQQLDYYISEAQGGLVVGGAILAKSEVGLVAIAEGEFGEYYGVTLKGVVEVRRGEGLVLVATEPRIGIDLQTSVNIAVEVATRLLGINSSDYDFVFLVTAEEEVDVVDGPSAGAAFTAALIAALSGRSLNSSVLVTGTIEPDGSIGRVGGILYKALAAAEAGAKLFLVPPGQSVDVVYVRQRIMPGLPFYRIVVKKIDVEQYLRSRGYDIEVREVSSITELVKFVLQP